jgi:hypothetical protein
MTKLKISEQFANSSFGYEYVKILAPISGKHMEVFLKAIEEKDAENLDYNLIGTPPEIILKKVSNYFGLLSTIFSDLELVLLFLRVKDREKLHGIFPELGNDEQYYIYHFENYIIRLTTVTDLIGKLGNVLYETGINEENCNGYKFREQLKKTYTERAEIITKLLVRTKEIKDRRHKKIHTGESDIPYLSGVVFFNDMMKLIDEEASPILNNHTDTNLIAEVDKIEEEILEIISLINEFLDVSIDKLKNIVEE